MGHKADLKHSYSYSTKRGLTLNTITERTVDHKADLEHSYSAKRWP